MPSPWSLDNKLLMSSLDHSSFSVGVDEILNVRNFVHAFVGTVDQPQGRDGAATLSDPIISHCRRRASERLDDFLEALVEPFGHF
jgi:hypothetical protein